MKRILIGALGLLALGVAALAQTQLGYTTFTGAEILQLNTGGPGGASFYATVSQVRNTTGYQLVTGTPTGTYSPNASVNSFLLAGQPASNTIINTPVGTAAFPLTDGALFQACNVTAAAFSANTTTLQAATGFTISGGSIALTTLGAVNCVELQLVLATKTWYRLR